MVRHRFRDSLVLRLLVIGVIIIAVGTILRYSLLTRFLRADMESVMASQQLALATYVARDVAYKLQVRMDMLQHLAASVPPALLADPPQLSQWLAERHGVLPLFSVGVMVLDHNGVAVADHPVLPGRVGSRFADNPDFHRALAGEVLVSKPVIGPNAKQALLPMAAPVRDAGGAVRAVLVGSTALAAPGFLDLLQENPIGSGGGFLLVSPEHQLFVAATDVALRMRPTPPEGVNPLHDRAMTGYRGTGITTNARGVEELSAIVSVPGTGWFVVARIPTEEAFATVDRAKNFVLRGSLAAITILIVFVLIIMRWTLRPLFQAAKLAERMTSDEIPLAALPVVRNDEIGHLTAAFNRLIGKLERTQAELARHAHHDALTGLPNRLLLADRVQQALARAERHRTRLAVLFMDLDGFKPINDAYGHEVGDAALRLVARRLQDAVRSADTLARVGGDEFVVLAADLDEQAEVRMAALAQKCIETLREPLVLGDKSCTVGVSIGIVVGDGSLGLDQMLMRADAAMYRAKQAGRGRYIFAANEEGKI